MDEYGDMGLYTGETNQFGQPCGKGKMKYENGVFFEGTWSNGKATRFSLRISYPAFFIKAIFSTFIGVRDGLGTAQRERLLSGFTSWKGAQSKKNGSGAQSAHGMLWLDPNNGKSGRYTGELNAEGVPHGRGVMRYDFGLIAEGEWVNGKIVDSNFHGGVSTFPPHQGIMMGGTILGGGASVMMDNSWYQQGVG